jgi:hypothetical protein
MARRSLVAGSGMCLWLLAACAADSIDEPLTVQGSQQAGPNDPSTPPPTAPPDAPETGPWTSPTEVDLLVVVDDSADMALALPLVEKSVKELARDLVAQGKDLHLAIITTSLGTNGGNVCGDAGPSNPGVQNLRAHPVPSADGTTILPSSDAIDLRIGEVFTQIAATGCGFEQSLEAPYRFLIDPAPPAAYEVGSWGEPASLVGVDEELLAARAAFLRPKSAVVVLSFTTDDDSSMLDVTKQNGVALPGYLPFQLQYYGQEVHFRTGTASCATAPESESCMSCFAAPSSPGCRELTAAEDGLPLRAWDQKRRFGADFLQPIDRYVEGYTKTLVTDRSGNHVPNPLFVGGRDGRSVIVANVAGVPWQDVAVNPHDASEGLRTVGTPGTSGPDTIDWNFVLGSTAAAASPVQFRPNDPAMQGSAAARSSTTPLVTGEVLMPPTSHRWNAVNGREGNTPGFALQAACVSQSFDDFTQSGFSNDLGCSPDPSQDHGCTLVTLPTGEVLQKDCDCPAAYEVTTVAADGTITSDGTFREVPQRITAPPSFRPLELARRLGNHAVVGSICPANVTEPAASDFGYRPIIQHLEGRIAGR